MPPTKQYHLIKLAFDAVKSHPSLGPKVTGRWITDGRLHELVQAQLVNTHLKDLTKQQFNRGLSAHPAFKDQITRQENDAGLYRLGISGHLFYWIGDKPKFPRPATAVWRQQVLEAEERVFSIRHDASAAPSNTVRAAEMDKDEDETPAATRPRHDDATVAQSDTAPAAEADEGERPAKRPRNEAAHIQQQTYWDSTEAIRLFLPAKDDASVLACIERRIQLFGSVGASAEAWRLVIDGGDPDDLCSSNDVFQIRQRCQLLCQAYIFAKDHMSSIPGPGCRRWKWSECCDAACKRLNPCGISCIKSEGSLRKSNSLFIQKDMFPHPNTIIPKAPTRNKKHPNVATTYEYRIEAGIVSERLVGSTGEWQLS
jgi:hypothetical protein